MIFCQLRERQLGDKPCYFDVSSFQECAKYPFGFDKKSPCVIVKLNKIFGLVPKPYLRGDEVPEEVPENIKAKVQNENEPRRVYIECHGENPADVEALAGKIQYFPNHQGIPLGYFPHQVSLIYCTIAV